MAANTPLGTYPITVTGNGGGTQHNTTLTLVVISAVWQQGFDFRASAEFVTDPPGDTDVIFSTVYPTTGTLTTYGWSYTANFVTRNRDNTIDPRLAGVNYVNNGTPAAFYVDLPAPGTYNVSLAMGDAGYPECAVRCQVQFLDGANVLATVSGGPSNLGYFYDAQGNNWSNRSMADEQRQPASNPDRDAVDGAGGNQPIHRGRYPDRLFGSHAGVEPARPSRCRHRLRSASAKASIQPQTCSRC